MVQARWYNEDTGTWEKFIVSNEGIQGPPGPLPDEDKIVRDLKEKVETDLEPTLLGLSEAELARAQAELDRQAQEEARETAEGERDTAEAQRKADHANRNAEFDDKADKVVLKNVVENGNFSNGTVDWVRKGSVLSVNDNEMTVTTNGTDVLPGAYYNMRSVRDHKMYARADLMAESPVTRLNLYNTSSGRHYEEIYNPIVDTWHTFSGIITATSIWDNIAFAVLPGRTSDLVFKVKNVIGIDLTETFGAGNEPTKEEMDELIKVTGYIDGEYALNNKEMLNWQLKLIRQNRNAIITLGGTF